MTMKTGTSLRIVVWLHLSLSVALLCWPGVPLAAPPFELLNQISPTGNSLDDIAFSPAGNIYAIDAGQNRVLIFDGDDQISGRILVDRPTAIAVSDSALYVGSSKDLSVAIRELDGQVVGYLGKGPHEFKLPRNIAIDPATNDIYVVDQLDQGIKVYTHDGFFLRRIDDAGNLPQDVVIVDDEIFVLDQPLITDVYGNRIRGAGVSVFDMTGTLIRSFGTYGAGPGEFVRPKAITVDPQGLIYINDAFNGLVLCFDQGGKILQTIQDPSSSMIGSMGLAIDQAGRLLVSIPLAGQLNVFLMN